MRADLNAISRAIKRELRTFKTFANGWLYRLEIPIEKTDILVWLFHQNNRMKFYYHDPISQFEMGGIGTAHCLSGVSIENYNTIFREALEGDRDVRYYGGIRFYQQKESSPEWQSFGGYHFFVPKYEIVVRKNECFFAYNFTAATQQDVNDLSEIVCISDKPVLIQPELVIQKNLPEYELWSSMVNLILQKINTNDFSKIVLARKTILEFDRMLDPYTILKKLKRSIANSIIFLFQPEHAFSFIGASPELLYRRKNRRIYSEVIAGTRSRGKNMIEDKKLADALLRSHKERHEHQIVLDSVMDAFQTFCEKIIPNGEISILQLSRVQHLYNTISGILKPAIKDGDILTLLHPTPAVGGYPRETSVDYIAQIESFDRGWYAGPLGWFNKEEACFSVAIRSGIIEQNRLSLFSGAGIVKGSQSKREWDEIESKISNFLRAVNVDGSTEKYKHPLGMFDDRRTYKERY
jgi:menaquinone-specific isochorismate synthase